MENSAQAIALKKMSQFFDIIELQYKVAQIFDLNFCYIQYIS